MNLAVVGSRGFYNYSLMQEELSLYLHTYGKDLVIVSGGAYGSDKLAERYAREHDLKLKVIKPEWWKYGKSAGYRRNCTIVALAGAVVAFWDGESKGTKLTIDIAKEKGVHLREVLY